MRFDRIRCGNGDGHVYEAFDPPWWHVARWARWWWWAWRDRGIRGVMRFTIQLGGGMQVERVVRIRRVSPPPRFNVEAQFKQELQRVDDESADRTGSAQGSRHRA